MDFEFSDDQELLRESVRRFLARSRAALAYVRDPLRRRRGRRRGLARARRARRSRACSCPRRTAARAWAWSTSPLVARARWAGAVYPGPFAASAVGAVEPRSPRSATDPIAGEWLPRLAAGDRSGRSRSASRPPARWRPRRPRPPTATRGGRRHEDPRARRRRPPTSCSSRSTPTPSVRGRRGRRRRRRRSPPTRRPSTARASSRRSRSRRAPARELGDGDATDASRRRVGPARRSRSCSTAWARPSVALELAVEYAKEREQFGKPIGTFQAVQHLCADMLRAVELGRAAAYYAAWACDEADAAERHRAVTMARAFAADGFYRVGATRDPGVRRRRLHVGARHPPLLQAAAHAAAPGRVGERSARGAGRSCSTPRLIRRDRASTRSAGRSRDTRRAPRSPARPATRNRVCPYDEHRPDGHDDRRASASGQMPHLRRRLSTTTPAERERERAGSSSHMPSVGEPARPALALVDELACRAAGTGPSRGRSARATTFGELRAVAVVDVVERALAVDLRHHRLVARRRVLRDAHREVREPDRVAGEDRVARGRRGSRCRRWWR